MLRGLMTDSSLVLALDQGGQSSRAIVFDRAGRSLARSTHEVAETHPGSDRVEQDPEELVRSLRRATKDALKFLGARASDLVAAGLATQRSSVVAWDKETGAALTPVISWQDRRAQDRIAALSDQAELVCRKTGLRLSPHYGASKLAWMLANVPAVASALRDGRLAFGPLSSFLAFRLLDERPLVADPANASRTLLWNVATGNWDPELCDLFGVPIGALPRCCKSRGEHGTLDVGKRKIPLRVVTGDQSAALFAGGAPDPRTAYVNFGTGAFVQRAFSTSAIEAPRLLKSVVFADDSATTLVLEGTVNGAGSALRYAVELLDLHDVEPDLEGWLAREADPPLFVNGVSGIGAPYWLPEVEARFIGEGTREAKLVAVLESVVLLVGAILREMESVLPRPTMIRVSGGLAQLDGLCQRLANLAWVEVVRATDPEGTARGLAWLVHADATFAEGDVERFVPREDAALRSRFEGLTRELELLCTAAARG